MIRCKKENLEWLEFEQLQQFPEVVHGVFLRHGGMSKGPFDSLNFGGGTGDDLDAIARNRKRVSQLFDLSNLITSKQMHADLVEWAQDHLQCDGLITTEENIGLLIKHADCQAAIFYDPVQRVIANVHCGWRGSVKNIYAKTVAKLQELGSMAKDLRVCISPSLGPEKAEFINHEKELPKEFLPFQVRPNYFDFWEISKMQLKQAGILEKHIEIAGLCTFCEKKDFFSHRRDKKTGRNGTVVALKLSVTLSQEKAT